VTYMDGKAGAEDLVSKAINDPELLKSLTAAPKSSDKNAAGTEEEK